MRSELVLGNKGALHVVPMSDSPDAAPSEVLTGYDRPVERAVRTARSDRKTYSDALRLEAWDIIPVQVLSAEGVVVVIISAISYTALFQPTVQSRNVCKYKSDLTHHITRLGRLSASPESEPE